MDGHKVVSSIRVGRYLIVPVQIELDDSTVGALQTQILSEIQSESIDGIIIDVSMVDVIDSYISYVLSETARMARLMGCHTVMCGIKPSVALTMAQMGLRLMGIHYAQNLDHAIQILERIVGVGKQGA